MVVVRTRLGKFITYKEWEISKVIIEPESWDAYMVDMQWFYMQAYPTYETIEQWWESDRRYIVDVSKEWDILKIKLGISSLNHKIK